MKRYYKITINLATADQEELNYRKLKNLCEAHDLDYNNVNYRTNRKNEPYEDTERNLKVEQVNPDIEFQD